MCKESLTFMYWDFVLRYENLISLSKLDNETLHSVYPSVQMLTTLFFASDQMNYS